MLSKQGLQQIHEETRFIRLQPERIRFYNTPGITIVKETEHKPACITWPCSTVERRVGLKGKQVYPSFKRGILECVEESKVSPQLVLQVTSGNWNVREEFRLKMWALCLLLKSKMMSKEGVFHLDVALAGVSDQNKIAVEKAIDECLYTKVHKPEETAWHFLKCYHKNNPKHSFM
ncbi:uncharacterized protein [Battus philenor]|uniref:uncharacterized protein n=1 Tax=Battus philenor TaxID=42288 RepID=UPI0035D034B0